MVRCVRAFAFELVVEFEMPVTLFLLARAGRESGSLTSLIDDVVC